MEGTPVAFPDPAVCLPRGPEKVPGGACCPQAPPPPARQGSAARWWAVPPTVYVFVSPESLGQGAVGTFVPWSLSGEAVPLTIASVKAQGQREAGDRCRGD